jgi:hypothetical protein
MERNERGAPSSKARFAACEATSSPEGIRQIWFDGAVFRLVEPVIPAGVLGDALPTCASTVRGRLWFVAAATGIKDSLQVCAKDATNTFAWRSLY